MCLIVLEKKNFDVVVLKAIDETFSLLGASFKESIYIHLEKVYKISKRDIPNKIEEFIEAIETIFGIGAKLLEIHIIKKLHQNVKNINFPLKKDLIFTEYIAELRQTL
jgi:hypothetical protein